MPQQQKLDCPICDHPRLSNLSDHLIHSHNISSKERKALLRRACFSVLSRQPDQSQPSIAEADSTLTQFGNCLPKTFPLPEQKKLPNPVPSNSTSDRNEDQLIPCPYDSCISYERIWGTNVDLMRRIYLTQQEMLKFMKGKLQDSLSPNLQKYYEARQEMNDWLEKDDVPGDTEATMYAQQLQRVKQLQNQVFRSEPSPVQMITQTEQTMTSESDTVTPSHQLNATDKQIIDFVSKTMQNSVKLLIQNLKDHSDVISWNDNGQLVLEGSIVPNSNIVDLVNDIMQKRKGFNPEHSNTFAKALTKIKVPEDYLRNLDRINSIQWYHRLQDSQAPGPSFVSETVEALTEVPQKTPKSPMTSALVYGKWLKAPC